MSNRAEELIKSYLESGIRHLHPCIAQGLLLKAYEEVKRMPFNELNDLLNYVLLNQNGLPKDFIEELKFEYIHRGGKIKG
jgi:hypothetical protein